MEEKQLRNIKIKSLLYLRRNTTTSLENNVGTILFPNRITIKLTWELLQR